MTSIIIGNTYRRIPEQDASLDQSGRFPKVHDWTVFVDVVVPGGEPRESREVMDSVVFDLGSSFQGNPFVCRSPVPLVVQGKHVWRFSTRQIAWGLVEADIQVRGAAGKVANYTHNVMPDNANSRTYTFSATSGPSPLRMVPLPATSGPSPLRMVPLPPDQGVELECTSFECWTP